MSNYLPDLSAKAFGLHDPLVVERYVEDLESIGSKDFNVLHPDEIKANHSGHETLGPDILPNGVHLSSNLDKCIPILTHALPDSLTFIDDDKRMMRLGKEDSARKVFFGKVLLGWEGLAKVTIPVAVKPFTHSVSRVFTEFAMSNYVKSVGIDTFRPLLIQKHGSAAYLLTFFDSPVTTFDNTPWDISKESKRAEAGSQLEACAQHMAELHGNLIVHRDAQVRNIGHREDVRKTVAVDLETAVSYGDVDLLENKFLDSIGLEHLTFFRSLIRRGYGKDQRDGFAEIFMHFEKHYIEPYSNALRRQKESRIQPVAGLIIEALHEEIMDFTTSA